MARQNTSRRPRIREAGLAAAVTLIAAPILRGQSTFDQIGLTPLLDDYPNLTFDGTGVEVGQVESLLYNAFEVDPATVAQPDDLFTYIDQYGTVSYSFVGIPTGHQDIVANLFYGTAPGIVTNVSHVDNMEADYFESAIVANLVPIPDAVINVSSATNASQQASDSEFDNYTDTYGTIFVIGAGGSGPVIAPSTAYNAISVGDGDYQVSPIGPTVDNGRSKPDITAPGSDTSYAAPLVSGAATILVQAGTRGDGGRSALDESEAVDFRTVKALLLNGTVRDGSGGSITEFTRTPVEPLDPLTGAGLLNIYNSYQQLAAGTHTASSVSTTTSVGAAHLPMMGGTAYGNLTGWDFAALTSSATSDAYANYLFQPPAGTSGFSLTATLDWARQFNPNPATAIGINNLDLYLYDTITNTLLDWSNSAVDNVQDVYDTNLIAGHTYDLEVLKDGGAGVVSNTETYALAFTNTANTTGSVNTCTWTANTDGYWGADTNWYNDKIAEQGGEIANFTNAITAPVTVTLDYGYTVGQINFYNTNSYTITAVTGYSIPLYNGDALSHITDGGGDHFIIAPIALFSTLQATVLNSGDTLTISGDIADGAASLSESLESNGNGTLVLRGTNTYSGGTTVESGMLVAGAQSAIPINSAVTVGTGTFPATLQLAPGAGNMKLSSLQINSGGVVDLANGSMTINYGSPGFDPIGPIVSALKNGYNGAITWTGTSSIGGVILSSSATGSHNVTLGYLDGNVDTGLPAVQPNQILVRYTIIGDSDLSGEVDFADLAAVLKHFNQSGTDWAQGNFEYAASIPAIPSTNFNDLADVLRNFLQVTPGGSSDETLAGAIQPLVAAVRIQATAVPEPRCFVFLAASAAGLLGRRKRKPPYNSQT